ncbi:Ubiquitin-60S ribosomal protein L40 [Labeo rohita]|uniref:Ubiquitin-60S ribosomal protein L40 n=1 Tax=Labeo rohita TaxID=84645 RepID=A0ABQ8LEG7_LABRO|nr:Ubiquitin-60S ribosomal protein L40 [Labeo rohita]
MVLQVLINFNDKKNKPLEVADTQDKFNKTTVLELKNKFKEKIPGAPDPANLRVIFGKDPLEDNMTLVYYKITHLSVLFFVLKMPGGGMTSCSTGPFCFILNAIYNVS